MSAERSGSLPILALAELCFSGKYSHAEMKKLIAGKGGMVSHLGTNNAKEVEDRAEQGDLTCKKVMEAMLYQIAKLIGEMSTVLKGKVDRIVYTGGMAYSKVIDKMLDEYVSFIAPSLVYPGEDEMEALAINIYRVMTGETAPNVYQ
jgi:butyrate kinase